MRILLINPPAHHEGILAGPNRIFLQHGFAPPIGLMYLKSMLRAHSAHEVRLLNAKVPAPPSKAEIRRQVELFQPNLVGITVHTLNLYDGFRTAGLAKAVDPRIHVTLGGPHLRVYPRETLARPEVDSVVVGDGEWTLLEMCDRLAQNRDLEGVAGTWFKRKGELIRNPDRPPTKDLDQYPFPDRSDWNLQQHRIAYDSFSPSAVLIASRGCPFLCTFCATMDKHYRERSPQNVVDEMIACREMGYRSIDFYDDNFNLTERRVLELCDEIERRQVGLPWSCRCRVTSVNAAMIARMAETGCVRINFGVESATQEVLDRVKKQITVEDTIRAFQLTKQYGISTVGYFMIGFPQETPAQAWNTIRFAFQLDPDFVLFQCLVPGPGTAIYREALQDPAFGGDYFQKFAENPWPRMVCRTWETKISQRQLFRIGWLAYLGFYFRPRYLFRALRRLRSWDDFLTKARMALKILAPGNIQPGG